MATDYPLLGIPTVSKAGFHKVLIEHGAPLDVVAISGALYRICLEHGVDPGIALGFAKQEHSLRWLGMAGHSWSWGNSRPGDSWTGRVISGNTMTIYENKSAAFAAGDGGNLYRVYDGYEHGITDWCLVMWKYSRSWGLTTIRSAIPVYAPAADRNNPELYINNMILNMNNWSARFGGEMIEVTKATFTATVRSGETVNVRSGPGVEYALIETRPSGSVLSCVGCTLQGVSYTYNGTASSRWLQLGVDRWVSGHADLTTHVLPPDTATLQRTISVLTAWKQRALSNVGAARTALAKVVP